MSSPNALARQWRPKTFGQLVGQDPVVTALRNSIDRDRIHHAYLFTGTRGVGKTTLARIIAKALCCDKGPISEPCGECIPCREIDSGVFHDVVEMDAASHTKVDNMRDILESAMYAPTGRYKIYIIDEVHMLSTSAFNAMLKTLEEPPAHVKFVLATTDPQKVPVTVLSRCLRFNLRRIAPEEIASRLGEILSAEGVKYDTGALAIVAQHAEGSLRDALSLLDQAIAHGGGEVSSSSVSDLIGTVNAGALHDLVRAVACGDAAAVRELCEGFSESAVSFDSTLADLSGLIHKVSMEQQFPGFIPDGEDAERERKLAAELDPERLQLLYEIALRSRQMLSWAPTPQSGFEMALLRMMLFFPDNLDGAAPSPSPAPKRRATPSVADPAPAAPAVAQPSGPPKSAAEWRGVVAAIVAEKSSPSSFRAFLKRCQFESGNDSGVSLACAPPPESLRKRLVAKLEKVLHQRFGEGYGVEIRFASEESTEETSGDESVDDQSDDEPDSGTTDIPAAAEPLVKEASDLFPGSKIDVKPAPSAKRKEKQA